MGAPITFYNKYNPGHFKILGLTTITKYILIGKGRGPIKW